jgi:hypothetical protein
VGGGGAGDQVEPVGVGDAVEQPSRASLARDPGLADDDLTPGTVSRQPRRCGRVLARAVVWGMIDSNPAKQGVDDPRRRRTAKRPFESWAQLDELAARLGSRYGPPVLFAAATG